MWAKLEITHKELSESHRSQDTVVSARGKSRETAMGLKNKVSGSCPVTTLFYVRCARQPSSYKLSIKKFYIFCEVNVSLRTNTFTHTPKITVGFTMFFFRFPNFYSEKFSHSNITDIRDSQLKSSNPNESKFHSIRN